MTSTQRINATRGILALVAVGGVGVAIGFLSAGDWMMGLAVPIVILIGIAMLKDPYLGLLAVVATIPIQGVGMVGGATLSRLIGVAAVGFWLVYKLTHRGSFQRVLSSDLVLLAVLFTVVCSVSVFWAAYPTDTVGALPQLVQLLALMALVVDQVDSADRFEWFARILVAAAMFTAFLTMQQFLVSGARRAGDDIAGGVNATAQVLVLTLPFAFHLIRSGRGWGWAALGAAYIPVAAGATALTFSRMAFLLIPVILVVMSFHTLRGRQGRGWLAFLTVATVAGAVAVVPWDRVADRAATIIPYLQGSTDTGTATSPRLYHLRMGVEIFKDHPIAGVGYENYGHAVLNEYQYIVPGRDRLYLNARSPHSSHVGILADLGIVGTAIWWGILALGLHTALKSWGEAKRLGDRRLMLMAQTVGYSFFLKAFPYGFYASVHADKLFWAFLGLLVATIYTTRDEAAVTYVETYEDWSHEPEPVGVPTYS